MGDLKNPNIYVKDVKMRSTIISINLRKDEIVIKLSENATQEQIVEGLKKKLTEL